MGAPGTGYKIGEAYVEFTAKDTQFLRSLAGAKIALSAVATVFSTSTLAAAQFEKQMAYVGTMAVTRYSRNMNRFAKDVLNLSARFGQSTAALTHGLYDI